MNRTNLLRRFLDHFRIKEKLIFFLIPVILLTYLVSVITVYLISFRETKNIVDHQSNIVASQKIQLIDSYLTQLRTESEIFMFDTAFQKQLKIHKASLSSAQQDELEADMRQYMYSMIINYDLYVETITLINQYGDEYFWKMDTRLSHTDLSRRLRALTEETRKLDGGILYSYDKLDQGVITISRSVKDPIYDIEIGTMMIDFNLNFLGGITSMQTSSLGNADILLAIINSENDIVYNSSPLSQDMLQTVQDSSTTLRLGKTQYKINRSPSNHNDWTLFTIVNETELYRNLNRISLILVILMISSALVAFFAIFVISRTISSQFEHFIQKVSHTTVPDKQALITVESHDEFRDLAQVYNDMILRINQLIDTVYTKELLLKGAELKAFQAQINPHFLYNTLDCINGLVELNRPDDIKKTVTALASILRMSIKGKEILTVRENIVYIEQFMFIERLRYPDKLIFLNEIPENMMDYYMPKLIIQPLLENSILHGISEILGKGMIGLFGHEEEDCLVFMVKDNGIGFPDSVIEMLRHSADDEADLHMQESIGLLNIQKRIHLMYGTAYGLEIKNLPSGGSCVTVRLPKIRSAEPSEDSPEERKDTP
ncbi:sensor histidine kinase [Anaeromassilibacillus senegalensis]|uniref:Sensor histidine kinase n=1 Tax=Anaeromassilibacillus senegalensis TaxID=1673717 RepID=A0ABS9CQA0_9FIRM|nr:sensor histidine kinase [Anaeromassilibacillus senegalensis]MCF2652500.1 sensor histidine kinase [Anaeromassilibacillus senegalensis]